MHMHHTAQTTAATNTTAAAERDQVTRSTLNDQGRPSYGAGTRAPVPDRRGPDWTIRKLLEHESVHVNLMFTHKIIMRSTSERERQGALGRYLLLQREKIDLEPSHSYN